MGEIGDRFEKIGEVCDVIERCRSRRGVPKHLQFTCSHCSATKIIRPVGTFLLLGGKPNGYRSVVRLDQ